LEDDLGKEIYFHLFEREDFGGPLETSIYCPTIEMVLRMIPKQEVKKINEKMSLDTKNKTKTNTQNKCSLQ